MEARKLIGWNTRRLRVERGLTIEELAYRASIAAASLGRIERASIGTSVDTLEVLARALQVKLVDLVAELPKGAKAPKPLRAGRRAASPKRSR